MQTREQMCTFDVGGLHLAVPVGRVQEVLRAQTLTRVPLADAAVRGLMNLRGQIVTAVDLRTLFGLPAAQESAPMSVVVRSDQGPVSLAVDRVGDVLWTDAASFERTPGTVPEAVRELLLGVIKQPQRLLLVLDLDRALLGAGAAAAREQRA